MIDVALDQAIMARESMDALVYNALIERLESLEAPRRRSEPVRSATGQVLRETAIGASTHAPESIVVGHTRRDFGYVPGNCEALHSESAAEVRCNVVWTQQVYLDRYLQALAAQGVIVEFEGESRSYHLTEAEEVYLPEEDAEPGTAVYLTFRHSVN